MKNFTLLSLMLSFIMSFGANAQDFGGKLYVEDAYIAPGETAVLSVQLDNDIDISGFQLQMVLPDGVTYRSWSISEMRMPAGLRVRDQISLQRYDAQKLSVTGLLSSKAGSSFTQNSGEVATVVIEAAQNLPLGVYRIEVSGIDLSDPKGNDYETPATTFSLTVGTPSDIKALRAEQEAAKVYDLQGRKQFEKTENQPAIVNGQVIYRK